MPQIAHKKEMPSKEPNKFMGTLEKNRFHLV